MPNTSRYIESNNCDKNLSLYENYSVVIKDLDKDSSILFSFLLFVNESFLMVILFTLCSKTIEGLYEILKINHVLIAA